MDKKIVLPYILVSVSSKERSGLHQDGCRSRQHAAQKILTISKSDQQMRCLPLVSMRAGDTTCSWTESPNRIMAKCPCYRKLLKFTFNIELGTQVQFFSRSWKHSVYKFTRKRVALAESNLHSLFIFIRVSYAYTYTGLCQQHKPELNNKTRS